MDALRLEIATGQRACEILSISTENYDRKGGFIFWKTTKNGLPHCVPLPRQAVDILDALEPNAHGLYFMARADKSERARSYVVARLVRRYIAETGAEPFEARDLRRTWKTLAGAAGISKVVRDRLQNHALNDVSSRHYDRWEYMPEKRDAMEAWAKYLDQILTTGPRANFELLPSAEILKLLQSVMGSALWRGTPQARHHLDWVGRPIAEAFGLGNSDGWREAAWREATRLVSQGVLKRSMMRDYKSLEVPVLWFCQSLAAPEGLPPRSGATNRPALARRSSTLPPVSDTELKRLETAMENRAWRAAPQALRQPDWIGIPVARAFGFDRTGRWQARANQLASNLEQRGFLERTREEDSTGREVPMYRCVSGTIPAKNDAPEIIQVVQSVYARPFQGDLFGT